MALQGDVVTSLGPWGLYFHKYIQVSEDSAGFVLQVWRSVVCLRGRGRSRPGVNGFVSEVTGQIVDV